MKSIRRIIKKAKNNNIVLIVFSLLLSIVIWSVVKTNFSEDATKTLTGLKISIDSSTSDGVEFFPFYNEKDLVADVQVSGKSYDINSKSFSSSDIEVKATSNFINSSGYKVLNLTATSMNPDVTVSSISPSTITVFFDRKETKEVDVEAVITNDENELVKEGYSLGKPVPSFSTLEIEGPATVVSELNKVIFSAKVSKNKLPLKETTEVKAKVKYDIKDNKYQKFLSCMALEDEEASLTVTIPVTRTYTVPVSVNFLNQPEYYTENPLKYTVSPEMVDVSFSSEKDVVETLSVGTVDFRSLSVDNHRFSFDVEASSAYTLLSDVTSFEMTVDVSGLSTAKLSYAPSNIVFTSKNEEKTYSIAEVSNNLNRIVVVGPKDAVEKITSEDLQVEINVSEIGDESEPVRCEVSNIVLTNDSRCWVYGDYYCYVQAE